MTEKTNILQTAIKYAKSKNLSTGSNLVEFADINKADILAWSGTLNRNLSSVPVPPLSADPLKALRVERAMQSARAYTSQVRTSSIPFDNFEKPFGTPDTIHKIGNSIFIFSKTKSGVVCQSSIKLPELKENGIQKYIEKIGSNWSSELISRLWQFENTL